MTILTTDNNFQAENISATPAAFSLLGGLYGVMAQATWGGGSVTLQGLSLDGSTLITVLTAFSANGYATVYLPPGQYVLTIATATAVYVAVTPIPLPAN
jgi:hypothetical protein